jgi:hypothetical protein
VGGEYGVRLRVVVKRLMRDREIVMYILLCDVPISWICFFRRISAVANFREKEILTRSRLG